MIPLQLIYPVDEAVNTCIKEGILEPFLRKHRGEVWKEEGEERISSLIHHLINTARTDEIEKAVTDHSYREQLLKEFNI